MGTHTPRADIISVVDIGSNSIHLIIARYQDKTMQTLLTDKRIVRLAEGLDEKGVLSAEAIARGMQVMKAFAKNINQLHSNQVRIVATYTLRCAVNSYHFIRQVQQYIDVPINIISGHEEARLIYNGVAHTTPFNQRRLVIDIGGGSTEFAIGENFNPLRVGSQQMGCVTYYRQFFRDGNISAQQLYRAELQAMSELESLAPHYLKQGWDVAIGCSGTFEAIADYCAKISDDKSDAITSVALQKVHADILAHGKANQLTWVSENRRDVFAAGVAITRAIMQLFHLREIHISTASLREGVLYELVENDSDNNIRQRTVQSMRTRYAVDEKQVARVYHTGQMLLQALPKVMVLNMPLTYYQQLLYWACSLQEIGLHINSTGIHHHSAYIILNSELAGFSNEEKKLLSLMIQNGRKQLNLIKKNCFTQYSLYAVHWLMIIFRLAWLLNVRRLDNYLPAALQCKLKKKQVELIFPEQWLAHEGLLQEDLTREARLWGEQGWRLTFSAL